MTRQQITDLQEWACAILNTAKTPYMLQRAADLLELCKRLLGALGERTEFEAVDFVVSEFQPMGARE